MAALTKFKTGTYTGDGNATQAIVGVGFQPKHLTVFPQQDPAPEPVTPSRTAQDPAGDAYYFSPVFHTWYASNPAAPCLDNILSLDADGFTVGDGTGIPDNPFNTAGRVYSYICMG